MKNITLDFSDVTSVDGVYAVLKDSINLPEYFGYNLDALYDTLTEIAEETQFYITLSKTPEISDYMKRLYAVFSDAQEDNPNIYVQKLSGEIA